MSLTKHVANSDASQRTALPRDVTGWARFFDQREIPILNSSAQAIEAFRAAEDDVDAHALADELAEDPLFTLKLLRHVGKIRAAAGRDGGNPETVTEALVMLGITPFFRDFGVQPTVDDHLTHSSVAQQGLVRVLRRGQRAGRFALAFAIHRSDTDAAVIHEAALLHDFTELLLWIHAPEQAMQIAKRQSEQPGLRSADAQQQALNVKLQDVQQALMKAWHLPELLRRITDDCASEQHQVLNVQLAVRIARHSSEGWDNPAIPDDVADIASLLMLGAGPTMNLMHRVDI